MDENMSDDENRENGINSNDTAKRIKTDDDGNEESNSSNNVVQETASTSSDSGFSRSRSSRNRTYRSRIIDDAEEDSSPDFGIEEEVEISANGEPVVEENSIHLSGSDSDSTVVISDSDSDSAGEEQEITVLKKEKPKHSWFVLPEIMNRQLGTSSKYACHELFQRRCYGALHSVQRLELMYKLEEHDGCVNSLNFHPDGSLLASGSDDLKVVIWDWKIGKSLLKYDSKHRGNVFQSKFLMLSGDLHIATCARDGQVRISHVSKQEGVRENRKLGSHRGPCHKLALLKDQPHVILSAGEDGIVLSHDVRRNKPNKLVNVKDDDKEVALYSIDAHPLKTDEFCVSGRDCYVRIYDQRKTNTPVNELSPFKSSEPNEFGLLHVTCAVYNYNGSQILGSYNDADIYLFDANAPQGSYLHRYQGHRNGATIKGVNFFGPKSEFIVSGSDCGNVYFWEKNTESIVQWMLADDNGVVNCLEPHPSLPFICTSGLDWDVKVWVPSCEKDPAMKDLEETIKNNNKSRMNWSHPSSDINESQMLWMLWRHLRSTNRMRRVVQGSTENIFLQVNGDAASNSSSSSDLDDSSEGDSDDINDPSGCSAS